MDESCVTCFVSRSIGRVGGSGWDEAVVVREFLYRKSLFVKLRAELRNFGRGNLDSTFSNYSPVKIKRG